MSSVASELEQSTNLDRAFYISLLIKAGDSLLEVIGGVLILAIAPSRINSLAASLTQYQLSKNPHDYIATHVLKISHDFVSSGRYFAAFYLLSHGLVKLLVIIALFKQKMWAYPAMIIVLSAFIVYQVYRMSYRFSIGLLLLTIFDSFIIVLTWHEYQKRRK